MEKVETTAGKPIGLRSILIVLCSTLGTASYAFTWNSVGVALPHMQGSFSATTDQIAWVMIAFVIGSAMMTASVGWFSIRFGRKRIYLCALAGYTVTLLGCATATTLEQQEMGVGGAARRPCSWHRAKIRRLSRNVRYAPDLFRSTPRCGRHISGCLESVRKVHEG